MRGRRVFLENPKHVDVVLEERQLREIAMVAANRSEFIRDAIELALGHKDFAEGQKLRRENEELRRQVEELRRENEELRRQIEEAKKLIEVLKGERKAQGLDAKRYQTSFGWLTAEEIKAKFMEKKPAKPLEWLSAVLYNDAVAIQEVAPLLGLQDSSSSVASSDATDAKSADVASVVEDAAEPVEDAVDLKEKGWMERMLRAREVRRRRRLMMEMDFKALASELGCSEEEARRIVAEKFASSQASSESSGEDAEEESSSSELIKKARSIVEGY